MKHDAKLLAGRVARELKVRRLRLVLAESCTGGLVSALLTQIPGISEFHCGSAVVYQLATKHAWLRIPESILRDPGPVSAEVVQRMAAGVLQITPHADLSAAVTGHLGPNAPPDLDGTVYVAFARRVSGRKRPLTVIRLIELSEEPGDEAGGPKKRRVRRQRSAAAHLLQLIADELRN